MKEAPFGRVDSEDDLIDEYDTFTFKTRCMRKRSCLEKSQCGVLVVFVIVIVCLIVALATRKTEKGNCLKPEINIVAIIRLLDRFHAKFVIAFPRFR